MKLRKVIIDLIEDNFGSDSILMILKGDGNYSNEDIFKNISDKDNKLEEGIISNSIEFHNWFLNTIDKLREEVKSNNEFYEDVSKHDIIRSMQYFQREHASLDNELYGLKKYVEQLEQDMRSLQVKLEKTRICSKCVDCKDNSCLNNIWNV